jgi:hypothetical protein
MVHAPDGLHAASGRAPAAALKRPTRRSSWLKSRTGRARAEAMAGCRWS